MFLPAIEGLPSPVKNAVYTDTHLEDTSQAKKIPVSKYFDFSISMSCRQSLPLPFFHCLYLCQPSLHHTPIRIKVTP